jgi:hypothetical protein
MNTHLSFNLESSDPAVPLCFEVWINDQLMFSNNHVGALQQVVCDLPNDEDSNETHVLKFVLKNKRPDHTTVNEQGQIIKDAVLKISNIAFDDIELGHNLLNSAEYRHDFNGHLPATVTKFYNEMGCNGTVELKFSTPIYIWLLENM